MRIAAKILRLGCAALAGAPMPTLARAQSDQADLKAIAVHINRTPQQPWPGYGVYLGNGLILTAAHVAGNVAQTKPHVVIAGQDLPATLVKQGSLESVDLTLLSIDGTKLPVGLQMRRTPLCEHPPHAGEAVVVAIPEGTAPSRILSRRTRFRPTCAGGSTPISPMSQPPAIPARACSTPRDLCLLGIMSRKISITRATVENRRAGPHDRHRQVFRSGGGDQSLHPAERLVLDRIPRVRPRARRSNLVDDGPRRAKE